MAYEIRAGIDERKLSAWLKAAARRYATFPDGRVDYTKAKLAPVVMITVYCKGEILLVKRGYGLADAEGYWSTVNGFIDENKPVAEIAAQELGEELGLKAKPNSIKVASSYTMHSQNEKRAYIIFPCLIKLSSRPKIMLDYEHTDFKWIKRSELENYHILDDLPLVVDTALKLL